MIYSNFEEKKSTKIIIVLKFHLLESNPLNLKYKVECLSQSTLIS